MTKGMWRGEVVEVSQGEPNDPSVFRVVDHDRNPFAAMAAEHPLEAKLLARVIAHAVMPGKDNAAAYKRACTLCIGVRIGTGHDLIRFLAGPFFADYRNLTEHDSARLGDLFRHARTFLTETKG